MAKQVIDIGSGPNTNTGDSARLMSQKVNANFDELYDRFGFTPLVAEITSAALSTVDVAGFVSYINALPTSFLVKDNQVMRYYVTDKGVVFEIQLNGRSFGGTEPDIVAGDVKSFLSLGFIDKTQALYFYPSTSTVTFTADQKNMHFSRFTSGSPYGTFGLTLGNGIPEASGVIDMAYMGDTCVPLIVPFNCVVEEIIIRYSRNVSESGANTNIMFRMMSDTRYGVNNQMISNYNLVGTTHAANEEVSVSATVLSHSTISKGGGLKFAIRTNNATAQQFNIIRIMVIVKKV